MNSIDRDSQVERLERAEQALQAALRQLSECVPVASELSTQVGPSSPLWLVSDSIRSVIRGLGLVCDARQRTVAERRSAAT